MNRGPLLVSAGEASGDRIAALVLRSLRNRGNLHRAFGLGGSGCLAEGMEVIVSLSQVSMMGWVPIARKAWALQRAFRKMVGAAQSRKPAVALLVGFTSFNQALGRRLREEGIRVLLCVAPQVWAWRPSRLTTLHKSVDRLAVILPFEQQLWRKHGYDAHYVGHPALGFVRWEEDRQGRKGLVVLPGSRDQEVRGTSEVFFEAARRWGEFHPDWRIEVIVSPALSSKCESWLMRKAKSSGLHRVMADSVAGAAPLLDRYELALCTSGTACLETVIAGIPTVVGYRCDRVSAFIARRLLLTDHIALPNVLLGKRSFPELVQGALATEGILEALGSLHRQQQAREACRHVRESLGTVGREDFGQVVADLMLDL